MGDEPSSVVRKAKFLPAVAAFLVVAGAVYVAGRLVTGILENIVLPLLALLLGWLAARVVYRVRG